MGPCPASEGPNLLLEAPVLRQRAPYLLLGASVLREPYAFSRGHLLLLGLLRKQRPRASGPRPLSCSFGVKMGGGHVPPVPLIGYATLTKYKQTQIFPIH